MTQTGRGARWSTVPIENIYYLLCYAWDALEEGETIGVSPEQSLTIVDLFARVLVRGTRLLLTQGVDLDYRERRQTIAGLRGKLDMSATVKGMTWTQGKTVCVVAERSVDVPHNQILKATLRRLAALPALDRTLAAGAEACAAQLHHVRDVPLTPALFRTVRVHRNNRVYDLLMHVCRLIADNPFLETSPGHATFPDFVGERGAMARLFEEFIFHFYAREQRHFTVRRPTIRWDVTNATAADVQMLPIMRTDVVLSARDRRIVIDTKYYERAFQQYRGAVKLRSGHLFQIVTYLQNIAASHSADATPLEGILLYPQAGAQFSYTYTLLGHRITARTIDLAQPWRAIHSDLLKAIERSL